MILWIQTSMPSKFATIPSGCRCARNINYLSDSVNDDELMMMITMTSIWQKKKRSNNQITIMSCHSANSVES
jgi:hypothetical protein